MLLPDHRDTASAEAFFEQALEGMVGANGSDPIYFDNVAHPVSTRLGLGFDDQWTRKPV